MPRLYQRPSGWYVEFERGKARSLHTKDKAEARRLYAQIKRQLLAGKLAHLTGQCTKRLGEYCEEFLAWSEMQQPRSTWRANRLALDQLREAAGDSTPLDRVGLKQLDQMLVACRRRGCSTGTANNYLRHARASFNKAVEWGYLQANPLAQARELRTEPRVPAYLPSLEDVARFLVSIEDLQLRQLATAYIATGRRRRELLALTWEDVDLQAGRYVVRKSKAHLTRWYPINTTFRAVLESMGPGQGRIFTRWSFPDSVSKAIKRALVAAGFGHLTLHGLRHTFASHTLMQGRTLKDVQSLLGHTEARTTEIYAHLSDDHLAEAAEIYLGPIDLGLGRGGAYSLRTGRSQPPKKTKAAD